MKTTLEDKIPWRPILVFCALLFSLFTVFVQVTRLSLAYLQTDQLDRHLRIVEGVARSPYQYRVLSEYIVEWIIRAYTALDVPHSVISGFISFSCRPEFVNFYPSF